MKKQSIKRMLRVALLAGALSVAAAGGAHADEPGTPGAVSAPVNESAGWHQNEQGKYFILPNGRRATGMKKIGKYTYCFNAEGVMVTGWVKYSGSIYYMKKSNGRRVTGMKTIDGNGYYFDSKGRMKRGWVTYKKKKYYFKKSNGVRLTGMRTIGRYRYYFSKKGVLQTGLVKTSEGTFFFSESKGRMQKGWVAWHGNTYFMDPSTGKMRTGQLKINGTIYEFGKDGAMQANTGLYNGKWHGPDGTELYTSTIRNLLLTALKPVGSTLYVWGGGWNYTANGYGDYSYPTAKSIGVPASWKAFYNRNGSGYDYTRTRWQQADGLDCSGYVGWVMYNTFQRSSGHAGFVRPAQKQASIFSGYGWGAYRSPGSYSDYKAGDVMSLASGHVYIVVGQCSDGSVVLLHASPPAVMISGTTTRGGSKNSQAIKLARQYMAKFYPGWFGRYASKIWRGTGYLTDYAQMRWYTTSAEAGRTPIVTDPDGYRNKSAAKVLASLFA